MKVQTFNSAKDFLKTCQEPLLQDEATNNLPLSIGLKLREGHDFGDDKPLFAAVTDGDSVHLASLMTPPYYLNVNATSNDFEAACNIYTDFLIDTELSFPGVIGTTEVVECFAKFWQEKTEDSFTTKMKQRIYTLTKVKHFGEAPGSMRVAKLGDLDLILDWMMKFGDETGATIDSNLERMRDHLQTAIKDERYVLWTDSKDTPLSTAANARTLITGVVVNAVYTPPEYRGKGYATALVSRFSQEFLDKGSKFCCLFTDLSNPTSNSIYQRIGYEPTCSYRMLERVTQKS